MTLFRNSSELLSYVHFKVLSTFCSINVGSLGQVRVWTRIYFDLNVKPQTQFWEGISKMYVESMYVVCRNHFKHIWSPKRVPKWVLCLLQIEFQPVNSTLTQINSLFLILFKHLVLISLIVNSFSWKND